MQGRRRSGAAKAVHAVAKAPAASRKRRQVEAGGEAQRPAGARAKRSPSRDGAGAPEEAAPAGAQPQAGKPNRPSTAFEERLYEVSRGWQSAHNTTAAAGSSRGRQPRHHHLAACPAVVCRAALQVYPRGQGQHLRCHGGGPRQLCAGSGPGACAAGVCQGTGGQGVLCAWLLAGWPIPPICPATPPIPPHVHTPAPHPGPAGHAAQPICACGPVPPGHSAQP